jgi:carbonic anhydrase
MKKGVIILLGMMFLCLATLPYGCHSEANAPATPLERLVAGNMRFASGHPIHPDETLQRLRDLKRGQHPFVVMVSCSDSRVPPELVFDQGFGDIFSIRTAGNVMGDYELGSIEYAIEHFQCSLIVVLGHTDCGAIHAYIDSKGAYTRMDHIKDIVEYIDAEAEEQDLVTRHALTLDKAIQANILHGEHLIEQSDPILKKAIQIGKVKVVGALYDVETGQVQWM